MGKCARGKGRLGQKLRGGMLMLGGRVLGDGRAGAVDVAIQVAL